MRVQRPSPILIAGLAVLAFCAAPTLDAQKDSTLGSFYVVAHVFSDAAPNWFEHILDVQPAGTVSRVRRTNFIPGEFCPSVVALTGTESTVDLSPRQLSGGAKLCTTDVGNFNRTIAQFTTKGYINDTVAYTIVASCGAAQKVFETPYLEQLDLKGLRKRAPDAAQIVDLYSRVWKIALANRYEAQVRVESLLSELKSGRFDAGFDHGRMAQVLEMYRGPVTYHAPQPILVDDKWEFTNFVPGVYPPLARQARIQSKVELELTVDSATGRVTDANVISGHVLLRQSALDAARQWVFSTNQVLPEKLTVTLDYSLVCRVTQ